MAKLFYTAEEAAEKLGVTVDEVRKMAESGRIQEFRDRDKLMFKREQVDLLAKTDDDEEIKLSGSGAGGSSVGIIPLADDDGPGTAPGVASPAGSEESPKERSGISIFDTDDLEQADAAAQTQITASSGGGGAAGFGTSEGSGSGSGLLDLTREADDTSLGGDVLEEVYGGSKDEAPATDASGESAGGLFESTPATEGGMAMAGGAMMIAAEPYDGTWSGIAGGLAFAMTVILGFLLVVTVMALTGVQKSGLVTWFAENFYPGLGILAGVVALSAGVGWFLGRKG
ncbi:MAG: helix-turn-helix domain-containing protein [Phycisphaerae bacterium]|nr:helix-turn-helix domain-containing protein [Phycisphaerae bacterium]